MPQKSSNPKLKIIKSRFQSNVLLGSCFRVYSGFLSFFFFFRGFLKKNLCVYVCACEYMFMYAMCVQVPAEPGDSVRFLDLKLKWIIFYPFHYGYKESNMDSLNEQPMLLMTEPSLQSRELFLQWIDREVCHVYPAQQGVLYYSNRLSFTESLSH